MTIAEQLREKGREQGIQQGIKQGELRGIQKGMQQGEHVAAMKIARQMLSRGIGRDAVKVCTSLSDNELDNLMHGGDSN